jgi:hypothetical protein
VKRDKRAIVVFELQSITPILGESANWLNRRRLNGGLLGAAHACSDFSVLALNFTFEDLQYAYHRRPRKLLIDLQEGLSIR